MLKLILSILAVGNFALADSPYEPVPHPPLITKVNQTGFVPPTYRQKLTCEVYRYRVVVTKEMSNGAGVPPVIMKRVFPISLSSNIHDMIREASKDELQVGNIHVCDAPTTLVTAATPGVKSFVLFRSGSCAEPRAERFGGASSHLREIVDSFCPETHDLGGQAE